MRIYDYMKGILGAMGVGEDVGVPEPSWRIEEYLKAIYDKLKEGGGNLPSVTEADNGKVMAVVDGEWEPSLIPFDDEKIEQSVDAWLDDHPEATTTVQDGSITNAKLATSFVTPGTASAYSSSSTYAVGDYVFYNGTLYRCTTAITTAEAWTAAHWTTAMLGDDVGEVKSALYDETIKLIKEPTITANKWIDDSGAEEAHNGYSLTDYIDVSQSASFSIENFDVSDYVYYCLYDSNKTAITTKTRTHNNTAESINGYYLRITCATGNFTAGKIYTTDYTPIEQINKRIDALPDLDGYKTVNPSSLINDYLLKPSTDEVLSSESWVCTDFIELPFADSESITVQGTFNGTGGCAIYNAKKQKILGIDGNNVSTYGGAQSRSVQKITVPYQTGMKYIRISGWKANVSSVTDLGVTGKTIAGIYVHLYDLEQSNLANVSGAISTSKVLVIGDSISTDSYGDYKKWVTNLIEDGFLPYDTNNSSIHATGFVARYNSQANDFITRLEAVQSPESYDLVIVFGGINDFIQNIPMGSDAGTDYTVSFKPAVNHFFDYLIKNFTQARLCVLLPLRTYQTTQNTAGNYQQDYADYIKTVAKSYCLPVLNLTEDSGFCPFISEFKDMWTLLPSGYSSHDGVHPTADYEKKYLAPMIRHFLQGMM